MDTVTTALGMNELEPIPGEFAHDDRLEEADLLDRGLQLVESLLVEDLPGLLSVRRDLLHAEDAKRPAVHRCVLLTRRR